MTEISIIQNSENYQETIFIEQQEKIKLYLGRSNNKKHLRHDHLYVNISHAIYLHCLSFEVLNFCNNWVICLFNSYNLGNANIFL